MGPHPHSIGLCTSRKLAQGWSIAITMGYRNLSQHLHTMPCVGGRKGQEGHSPCPQGTLRPPRKRYDVKSATFCPTAPQDTCLPPSPALSITRRSSGSLLGPTRPASAGSVPRGCPGSTHTSGPATGEAKGDGKTLTCHVPGPQRQKTAGVDGKGGSSPTCTSWGK